MHRDWFGEPPPHALIWDPPSKINPSDPDPDSSSRIEQKVECRFDSPVVLRGVRSPRARFGSSLAILPDLNSDGLNDLAVGAPLEDDGQGAVYVFNSERTGISTTFSQVNDKVDQ